ncbi:hypothetical protein FACS1894180_0920 [Bacteroidia bacterium]|nr:hypothetical protein FACS1894180_0920 [Bacteroidia bacterium]
MKKSVYFSVLAVLLYSCKGNDIEQQETYNFPTILYAAEISNISGARLFIAGQEVFDTATCNAFMRCNWLSNEELEIWGLKPSYPFFDESDFLNPKFIPRRIDFVSKDTVIFRYPIANPDDPSGNTFLPEEFNNYVHYSVKWNEPSFVFSQINFGENFHVPMLMFKETVKKKVYTASDDYWEIFSKMTEGKTLAEGDYADLELNVINFRFVHWNNNVNDNATITLGIASRRTNEIDYDAIVNSMQPTDTFVFQKYKVRYKPSAPRLP